MSSADVSKRWLRRECVQVDVSTGLDDGGGRGRGPRRQPIETICQNFVTGSYVCAYGTIDV